VVYLMVFRVAQLIGLAVCETVLCEIIAHFLTAGWAFLRRRMPRDPPFSVKECLADLV
jgi:hypothetical protein